MNCDVTGARAPTVQDAFVDLICQDDELLRAEFDALIAASWQTPPGPPPPAPPRRPPPGATPLARPLTDAGRPHVGSTPIRRHHRRQRGPPRSRPAPPSTTTTIGNAAKGR